MTEKFEELLDAALEAAKTEPVTAVLDRYPEKADALTPLLLTVAQLDAWQMAATPLPNRDRLSADRAAFLANLDQLPETAVSPGFLIRLKGWLRQSRPAFWNRHEKREQRNMNVIVARALAAALVIFGLGSGTAALASDSLPDTPLYPVKLMMEDARLAFSSEPEDQANLQLALAQVRLQEMKQLAQNGSILGEPELDRLENHLHEALQLAAQLGDTEMAGLLTQMQTMLQNEQQTMAQLGEPVQLMFGELNQLMHQYQAQAQAGLEDPARFRWQHGQNPDWEAPCPEEGCEPAGSSHQYGRDEENGPQNDRPGSCLGDCEPNGNDHQHGQDNDNGQNSFNSNGENPGNSNQDGPGSSSCIGDCEPDGDQNQFGQEEISTGHNDPGNDSENCLTNCEPEGSGPSHEGDGNKHGNGH